MLYRYKHFLFLITDRFIINCVPLPPTRKPYLKDSLHKFAKYEIKWTSKIPISWLFSGLEKIQKYNEFQKKCFPLGKKEYCICRRIFDLNKFWTFVFLPKPTTCEMKLFKYKFTFNNNFMINKELNLCKI